MLSEHEADFYMTTLRELASLPTAAFHEDLTCGYIADFLKKHEIPYEIDRYGNIIAHYKTADCRPLALMAHTDHPAFELVRPDAPAEYPGAHWTARLLGGVARDYFEQPFRVRIFPGNDTSRAVGATGIGYKVGDGGPRDIVLYLKLDEPAEELTEGNFGIWDLPDFELRDGFIHARVIDDLVGCAAGLLALWKAKTENYATNLYGVFTRAEEVGLVGADLLFAAGTLPRETFIVSIEASRTLPGAIQGAGPVIRVGDRAFTFSEQAEFVLKRAETALRNRAAAAETTVKIQRQLMSGGRCEASSAIMNGYIATGLAFPLGNYHNMGAHNTLEMENIHQDDYLTGVLLLQEAARLLPSLGDLLAAQKAAEALPPGYEERLMSTRRAF
jgi:putative aminopeptidase FrvX